MIQAKLMQKYAFSDAESEAGLSPSDKSKKAEEHPMQFKLRMANEYYDRVEENLRRWINKLLIQMDQQIVPMID